MKLRTSRGLVAIALGTALVLSGCASGDGGSASPSATESAAANDTGVPTEADIAALDSVVVTGTDGDATLAFDKGLTVSTTTSKVVTEGDGDEVAEGDLVTMQYIVYQGSSAELLGSTWTDDAAESFTVGDASYELLNDALIGQKVGAQVLVAFPSQEDDQTTDTRVNLIQIVSTKDVPDRAEGEAFTPAEGLPVVTLDDTGKPSIDIPEGYADPTELVVQTLIKGSGPEVTADQTVTTQYTGWTLDGESFDSSWENGAPATFPLSGVIEGWTTGLAGQTVGSQVLLVVPAALAYGAEASETNPLAGKTLVFVVDILDAS